MLRQKRRVVEKRDVLGCPRHFGEKPAQSGKALPGSCFSKKFFCHSGSSKAVFGASPIPFGATGMARKGRLHKNSFFLPDLKMLLLRNASRHHVTRNTAYFVPNASPKLRLTHGAEPPPGRHFETFRVSGDLLRFNILCRSHERTSAAKAQAPLKWAFSGEASVFLNIAFVQTQC